MNNKAYSLILCILAAFASEHAMAADPSDFLSSGNKHPLVNVDLPPGVIGKTRLTRPGPLQGYYQPVAFHGPEGAQFALSQSGAFEPPQENLMAGMLIGGVYRFKLSHIPGAAGVELYPTIEVIDRTYPPPGLATKHPIPIVIDEVDIRAVMDGRMVTRVVYLEDPQTAIALPNPPSKQHVMELSAGQDPLAEADRFGRPVAIIRIGTLAPPTAQELMPQFFFGFPSWAPIFQPEQ